MTMTSVNSVTMIVKLICDDYCLWDSSHISDTCILYSCFIVASWFDEPMGFLLLFYQRLFICWYCFLSKYSYPANQEQLFLSRMTNAWKSFVFNCQILRIKWFYYIADRHICCHLLNAWNVLWNNFDNNIRTCNTKSCNAETFLKIDTVLSFWSRSK